MSSEKSLASDRLKEQIALTKDNLLALEEELTVLESDSVKDRDTTTPDLGQRLAKRRRLDDASRKPRAPEVRVTRTDNLLASSREWPLSLREYPRYGRQMIVPQIGLTGQLSLKSARILIVGLGGLGCPAATYLAAAGVRTLGLIDGDEVEISNLHRQTLHDQAKVGVNKAISAAKQLHRINTHVNYKAKAIHLAPGNALRVVENRYDLILDCTDQPSTRYMLSDIAVIAGIPLISASALKTEGQLLVLNNPPARKRRTLGETGFCYRCVFPKPPPAASVQACSEAGILGPVVGVMGCLMATEAIKILTSPEPSCLEESAKRMLLYSAYNDTPFRSVRLKGKRANCPSCSLPPKINRDTLTQGSIDYVAFCGLTTNPTYPSVSKISTGDLKHAYEREQRTKQSVIIDVRNETEFGICHLPESINIPLTQIESNPSVLKDHVKDLDAGSDERAIFFICRLGNDSHKAAAKAEEYRSLEESDFQVRIFDVEGGLKAWKNEVEPTFPEY